MKLEKQRYRTDQGLVSYLKAMKRRKAYLKKCHVNKHGGIKIKAKFEISQKSVIKTHIESLQSNSLTKKTPKSKDGKAKIKAPQNFCLISNPEESLQFIAQISNVVSDLKYNTIDINHRTSKEFSLGAECFLACIVKELTSLRELENKDFSVTGFLPLNIDHADLLREIGIVKELNANVKGRKTKNKQKIHLFSERCVLDGTDSASGEDHKTNTTLDFVNHINNGLKDHRLKLKDNYQKDMKTALAEILDNAEEHSHLNAPKWFVKGYLNNNCKKKMLELVIFNFGSTVYENFMRLPEDNYTRKRVDPYVNRHKDVIDEEVLYNIMAMQVRVSTENFTLENTRGHGTIKLLKLFQSLYTQFKSMSSVDKDDCDGLVPEMSFISGHSYLLFDGTYNLVVPSSTESKKPILTFNLADNEMKSPPDGNYVKKMSNAFFPGAIISIRVPLVGSIEKS